MTRATESAMISSSGFVFEAPRLHDREAPGQQRVKMGGRGHDASDGERHDLVERQRAVAKQPPMLGRDLAGLVGELPRRIGKCGTKVTGRKPQQVLRDIAVAVGESCRGCGR